jgi:Xaa-Pro aminopeptidase
MKYLPISRELFIHNRENLRKQLKTNGLAVFNSNDIMPTNADGTMPFRQNNDLFYLSGIDQEESILLVFPEYYDKKFREVLFLKETNENIRIWEGEKYTKEEARKVSGIETVLWISDFEGVFNALASRAEVIYLNTNEHLRAVVEVETRDARFIKSCQNKFPLHRYERLAPIMQRLRMIKSVPEIELISKACEITAAGFKRALKMIKPGVMEYEVEAEYAHEFLRNRSRGFAFQPIIASGANSCVLHYITNNNPCKDGDLLLMDVGAEYANYNGDLTRTVPVNGRFTDRQRKVYEAVLRVQRGAMQLLQPGNNLVEYHKEVGKLMELELIQLGLLKEHEVKKQDPEKPLYKKYFMHGTSHHLGLDVHDLGNPDRDFEPGMVFTIEPGIYIREEQIGIRLENDVVIQKNGLLDLMSEVPIEPDEIEELMNSR